MSLMMALFPFVLFTVALAGTLSQGYVTDELIDLIFGAWPKDVADPIVAELRAVLTGSGSGVITLGGLLAIYFASNGVAAVRVAMNQAYHDQDSWPFWENAAAVFGAGHSWWCSHSCHCRSRSGLAGLHPIGVRAHGCGCVKLALGRSVEVDIHGGGSGGRRCCWRI